MIFLDLEIAFSGQGSYAVQSRCGTHWGERYVCVAAYKAVALIGAKGASVFTPRPCSEAVRSVLIATSRLIEQRRS